MTMITDEDDTWYELAAILLFRIPYSSANGAVVMAQQQQERNR